MEIKKTNNKYSLLVDKIEVGYIEYQITSVLSVNLVYIYPGYRENGYGKELIKQFVSEFAQEDIISNCRYFQIFANENNEKLITENGDEFF